MFTTKTSFESEVSFLTSTQDGTLLLCGSMDKIGFIVVTKTRRIWHRLLGATSSLTCGAFTNATNNFCCIGSRDNHVRCVGFKTVPLTLTQLLLTRTNFSFFYLNIFFNVIFFIVIFLYRHLLYRHLLYRNLFYCHWIIPKPTRPSLDLRFSFGRSSVFRLRVKSWILRFEKNRIQIVSCSVTIFTQDNKIEYIKKMKFIFVHTHTQVLQVYITHLKV